MLRLISVGAVALSMAAGPCCAATTNVDSAIKSLEAVSSDASKLKSYCDALKELHAAGEDPEKQAEADDKLSKVLLSFGPQFKLLLEIYDSTDPESDDSKRIDDAFFKLDSKCEL